ncbi:helix-turn-helix transcriptional regulator [Staphylococcus haemolyticus]|jgi:AraC-like DNA-binding protein|uniref:AraC family transcriptional regulator n=10 Tax=Staphylococcus TaxID=1279 RepID=A0A2A1KD86_STAHA|nr:AraC family transcriptional regulator [Staphylococcus haemolyticus]KDP47672.1 DNA-binding helix-turn-helix protein [Staphylococcus aureus subsp. aureus CO-98]OFM08994.1 AraC family transcriptional regulator [Staphylococcus sp. HMSC074C02]OFM10136.1 AraC family transcriptional regulator [Staphylococcus sp. HMSC069D07]OFM12351.1 AraC family transcriptional regulator [Staphylococcus sp. HMSC074A11]OFM34494.1 AraC family transcriptional regulator [Staphylococcus sp. HMSC076E07]OFM36890.1 AraC 
MIDNFSVKLLKNIKISSQKESNIKLIYWLKGSGRVILNLKKFQMKERDLLFVMLNDIYSIENEDGAIIASIEIAFKDYLKYADDYIKSNGYKFPSIERKQLEPFILNLLDFESSKSDKLQIKDKLVKHLCVELGYLQRNQRIHYKLDNALVDKVHEYIINHHSNKISRQDMANALNMSAKELSKVIKYHTPYHNITQYINDVRLKLCLIDILKSNHLIQDIAYKHGFNHFPHFIALFNKKYGITPGQIRTKNQSHQYQSFNQSEIPLDEETQLLIAEAKDNYSLTE